MFRLVTKQCAHHLRALVNKPVARFSRILKIVDLEQPGRGKVRRLAVFDTGSQRSFALRNKVPSRFLVENSGDKIFVRMAGDLYEFSDFMGADVSVDGGTLRMVQLSLLDVESFPLDTLNGPVYPAVLIGAPELEKGGVSLDMAQNKIVFPGKPPVT